MGPARKTTRMTNTIEAIAVVLLISASTTLTGSMQSGAVRSGGLNPRIGPPALQRYKSIRDAKDWENPYLVIRRDGIEVISKRLAAGRTTVAADRLEQALVTLPITAWPYGRVVAVQEVGLIEPGRGDEEQIAENLEKALTILRRLNVTADRWPS